MLGDSYANDDAYVGYQQDAVSNIRYNKVQKDLDRQFEQTTKEFKNDKRDLALNIN